MPISTCWTFKKGANHEQTRRNPLAVGVRHKRSQTTTIFHLEIEMQNEIEILEPRETPTIFWY
jgi:hypothetical protein